MVWRLLCLIPLVASIACPAAQPQPARHVTIEITVTGVDNKPIRGVTIGNAKAKVWGTSDSDGHISLSMNVSDTCREVYVNLCDPDGPAPIFGEERRAKREQFKQLCSQRSFR